MASREFTYDSDPCFNQEELIQVLNALNNADPPPCESCRNAQNSAEQKVRDAQERRKRREYLDTYFSSVQEKYEDVPLDELIEASE